MAKNGYISEPMTAGRIVAHGKITSLTDGFSLEGGVPFSIYIKPKYSVSTLDTVVSVRCWREDEASEAPIAYNDWSPLAIAEIASGQNDLLTTNDIYWGAGWVEE